MPFLYLSKSVGITSRQNKKVEEEEKLLKLFQGVNKAQDGFTQWCEQMLHALNTANNLDGKRWEGLQLLCCGKTVSGLFLEQVVLKRNNDFNQNNVYNEVSKMASLALNWGLKNCCIIFSGFCRTKYCVSKGAWEEIVPKSAMQSFWELLGGECNIRLMSRDPDHF